MLNSHPGFFVTGLNVCLNAGRMSGGSAADWLSGGCTYAVSVNNSIKRLPSCKIAFSEDKFRSVGNNESPKINT